MQNYQLSSSPKKLWTIRDMLAWLTGYFQQHKIENAKFEAESLLSVIFECSRLDLYLDLDKILQSSELQNIKRLVLRRKNREPLPYISNYSYFWKFKLVSDKRALIPRFDSELLVSEALALNFADCAKSDLKILDWGTGSGALAISLALETEAEVVALDIDKEALSLAAQNLSFVRSQFPQKNIRVKFLCSDSFSQLSDQKFDIIIANPPYISAAEYDNLAKECHFEPKNALLAADNGFYFFNLLADQAINFISNNGYFLVEHGYQQRTKVCNIFELQNWHCYKQVDDYNNKNRLLIFRRTSD